ncbi:MAG: hypothetical protein J6A65_02360 [Pseudomonas sp.]|nr:hypothetical protein [Pseudomonas sp.]MBP3933142.1 hypothetical protein [Pseudomonas sp.]
MNDQKLTQADIKFRWLVEKDGSTVGKTYAVDGLLELGGLVFTCDSGKQVTLLFPDVLVEAGQIEFV